MHFSCISPVFRVLYVLLRVCVCVRVYQTIRPILLIGVYTCVWNAVYFLELQISVIELRICANITLKVSI